MHVDSLPTAQTKMKFKVTNPKKARNAASASLASQGKHPNRACDQDGGSTSGRQRSRGRHIPAKVQLGRGGRHEADRACQGLLA
jgi:hypothetical protein